MTDLWNYRIGIQGSDQDLTGYHVEATDGHVGKIDASNAEVDNAYLVVATGFWLFGKKRLIPARAVKQINHYIRAVFVDLPKDDVKNAPDFDSTWQDPDRREALAGYFDAYPW